MGESQETWVEQFQTRIAGFLTELDAPGEVSSASRGDPAHGAAGPVTFWVKADVPVRVAVSLTLDGRPTEFAGTAHGIAKMFAASRREEMKKAGLIR